LTSEAHSSSESICKAGRPLVFLSHATPEDNDFVLWLGTRLTALGYEVWADILKLRGGQDWTELLEEALKERANKVLLVATPLGLSKKGVQREIKIAQQVAAKLGDNAFIIPLRKEPYDLTFDTALAQYVDFKENWGRGLVELVKLLDEYHVPRTAQRSAGVAESWRALIDNERAVVELAEERLISNAIPITVLPKQVGIYEIAFANREAVEFALRNVRWPHVRDGDHLLGFCAPADYLAQGGQTLAFRIRYEVPLAEFAQKGFDPAGIADIDARRHLISLLRQHWNAHCEGFGLSQFEFAGRSLAWWPTTDRVGEDFISFPHPFGGTGRRQLSGTSLDLRWHYGVTAIPRLGLYPSFTLVNRVIFTIDGKKAIDNPRRMHRLRRSRCKLWHNDRWRDLVLAFAHWLAEANDTISLSCGSNDPILVAAQPRIFLCDVRLAAMEGFVSELEEDEDTEESDDDSSRVRIPQRFSATTKSPAYQRARRRTNCSRIDFQPGRPAA
jgi:hypothetical protein